MSIENFTTYTEVDPSECLTVAADNVAGESIPSNASNYIYKDKGVDHFNGDFIHYIDIIFSATTLGATVAIWLLANEIGSADVFDTENLSNNSIRWERNADGYRLILFERDGANQYTDIAEGLITNTNYYLKIVRDENVGDYGTLYCYIYSDAARTVLVDTLTITLHTSKKDYRYIYPIAGYNQGGSYPATGVISNLDLNEITAHPRSQGHIF